jgi:hypothetical protein
MSGASSRRGTTARAEESIETASIRLEATDVRVTQRALVRAPT